MSSTLRRLLALDEAAVERVLRLRPDARLEPVPRDLRELAERLDSPDSVSAILETAALPALQLAEAVVALQTLHGGARRSDLVTLVAGGDATDAAIEGVDRFLSWLTDRLVVTVTEGEGEPVVHGCRALEACFDEPLDLDRPAAELHGAQTARALQDVLSRLGLPSKGSKAELLEAVVRFVSDPDAVRALISAGPPDVATWLAWRCLPESAEGLGASVPGVEGDTVPETDEEDDLTAGPFGSFYDAVASRREHAAAAWAAEHGLVVGMGWGGPAHVPAEVALAVRGPAYRAPFTPSPPPVPTWPVTAEAVERESAAAASAFAEHAVALLDLVDRVPLATVKAGGVGARELTRLAKTMGTGVAQVRLALESAGATGLLRQDAGGVRTSPQFAAWRQQQPATRLATLLQAWLRMAGVPTADHDEAARPLPALARRFDCARCLAARQAALAALRSLPPGEAGDLTAVAALALWSRPLVHAWCVGDATAFASTWREAELLGVVARGTLSPLGRVLVDGDDVGRLADLAATLLPATTEEAVFGSDLTVVATGSPSARVTRVLDSVADREGRGGAVVWRVTPGSIRRALDGGATAGELERDLAEIARSGLPQPLRYLLQDVGRRHGAVRVRQVASCLRSEDTVLLAQVAADRSLRRLGLHLLAPTVAASAADATTTVEALRAAGYLPVIEDADGTVLVRTRTMPSDGSVDTRPSLGRSRGEPDERDTDHAAAATVQPDVARLARELVRAGDPGPRQPASLSEARVRAQAPHLSAAEARLLGYAIDAGEDVVLDYVAASGSRTQRRVSELVLAGGIVQGWCHLRQDERYFSLAGIAAVHPAPPS